MDRYRVGREPGLGVQAGFATHPGRRPDNQDYVGLVCPEGSRAGSSETLAVVADGCGGFAGGRTASELTVRGFVEGYLGLSETLGVHQRASRSLGAINSWIHAVGLRDAAHRSMATTVSVLVLVARRAHVIHVGDSRIYRLRGERLDCLTQDHTLNSPGLDHVLSRAVGLEAAVPADCEVHPMETHDRYLLCTDGLHGALSAEGIRTILRRRQHPQTCAEALVEAALAQDGSDNITAAVLDVTRLPPPGTEGLRQTVDALPILDLPSVGDTVDGYRLEASLSKGHYSSLFLACDQRTGARVVLKFPHPRVASETTYREAFTREAWIGLRIKSPWVAEVIEPAPGRQSRLYSVMPHYQGDTLEARLARGQAVDAGNGIDIALNLCRAAYALHRQGVIHRDIKPENILLPADGGLKLLDLGVALLPGRDEGPEAPAPGTASYLAPELFQGQSANAASDVFAIGVTLYRLFTGGHYPYGEIEPFTHPRFGRFRPVGKYRPDLPAWLDTVIQRAVAVDPKDRYADTIELAFELENGRVKGAQYLTPPRTSWFQRNPLRFWQIAAILQFLLFLFWFGFRSIKG